LQIDKRLGRAVVLGGVFVIVLTAIAQTGEQAGRVAQVPVAQLTWDQLTSVAKRYFRDTTEFPLRQRMEFSISDPSGRIRKRRRVSADYVFQNNLRTVTYSGRVSGKMWLWEALRGGKKTFSATLNGSWLTVYAGGIVYMDPGDYVLQTREAGDGSGSVTASLVLRQACTPFSMEIRPESYFPDDPCGTLEFQVDRDLSFRKFVFESSGLPVTATIEPFGSCELRRYHAEVELQTVTAPGDKDPLLIPKRATTTLETSKGRIVIVSVYQPKHNLSQTGVVRQTNRQNVR
jgi:hypothetical protein